MKHISLALVVLAITGCTTPTIVLQNPMTQQTVRCSGDNPDYFNPARAAEACARTYEKAGYQRVGKW